MEEEVVKCDCKGGRKQSHNLKVERKVAALSAGVHKTGTIAEPFDGTGYIFWKRKIILILEQSHVAEVLMKKPFKEEKELKEYKMSDIKARNIITQCLADNVLSCDSISDAEIITLLRLSMPECYDTVKRVIDIIFSEHPDVDLHNVMNALFQELWQSDKKKSECKFSLRKLNVSSTNVHQRCEPDCGTTFVAANRDQNVNKQCLVGVHLQAHMSGTVKLTSREGKPITIKDVPSCDNLEFNLLSVKKIESHSFKVLFDNAEVKILNKNSTVVVTGNVIGNLYMIKFQMDISTALTMSNEHLIHRRMCHSYSFSPNFFGKQTRKSFKSLTLEKKPTKILKVGSSNVIGPITPPTYDSKRYIVTLIDHFSYFAVVYLLSYKSECPEKFEEYEAMITAKFGTRISRICCENGGEYSSRLFIEFRKTKGIQVEYTIPRNPECMLLESKVENTFWGEAVCAATYVLNRIPTRTLKEGCPAVVVTVIQRRLTFWKRYFMPIFQKKMSKES
ncbi:hypothetical protein PR048_025637 [Dryococelus australis]|uniref:Integrase catalytic domain-containing protein n=1 Tax=Dryococelus australis TaxID=614101 RepID=A0ABQ9GRU6_9NEOP|nr:hypothetical protein PR048_025637 [Dryococelus australis]